MAALLPLLLLVLVSCGVGQESPPGQTSSSAVTPSETVRSLDEPEIVDGVELIVDLTEQIEPLEEEYQAVVGVYAFDVASGAVVAYRDDERFAYASTIKSLAAAAVLDQVRPGELDEIVTFSAEDLVFHSPVTEQHVENGMTLHEVIDAAIRHSDNTAGNLLFERLGGPEGLQAALHDVGDETTVVSRWEPDLNAYVPGDDRDTTTAQALATTLGQYAVGGELDDHAREILLEAMRGVRTGDGTIRAGVPQGWDVANKTGTGGHGTRNDVAVLWPDDGGAPILLAVLTRTHTPDGEPDDALLAQVTAAALEVLAPGRTGLADSSE